MKKIILLILIAGILSGCALFRPHRNNIEQGNIITPQEVSRLHHGMTQDQVKAIMGTPLLVNLFSPSRVDYIYTIQYGYNDRETHRLTCLFQQGRLREIIQN